MTNRFKYLGYLLSLLCMIFIPVSVLHAAENTNPPTVTSITGPTVGVVNKLYSFSATITSTDSYAITEASLGVVGWDEGIGHIDANSLAEGCDDTSCTVTGSFAPATVGTYVIYVTVNANGASCNTLSTGTTCLNSSGKYITFVVSNSLPSTGIIDNQMSRIYIGLGFICLGILATQTTKISSAISLLSSRRIEKKKSTLEKKFK